MPPARPLLALAVLAWIVPAASPAASAGWRIESVDATADPVARLWAAGRIRAASPNPPPWPKRSSAKYAGRTPAEVDALLAEMRGDR